MEVYALLPLLIPFAGMLTAIVIVWAVVWHKAHEKELQFHQDLRLKEMEHQRRMKELELEVEKVKATQVSSRAA